MIRVSRLPILVSAIIAGGLLVLTSGCDDPQARGMAGDASAATQKMQAELSALTKQNAAILEKLNTIQDAISKQVNDRMEKAEKDIAALRTELMDQLGKDGQQTRLAATGVVQSARTDFDKEITGLKTTIAGDVQKIREEMKATMDDLKKYMDNQLRDLYPYAYQPHRADKTPPAADPK
ncbi:MAG TPA: hypothetical protein VGP72_13390 [Planctomycetota bacterium]|jgi:chromosome segregation ATPase